MKKIQTLCLVLALVVLLGSLSPVGGTEPTIPSPDASVTNGCHSVDAVLALSDAGRIAETAQAVIVYERNSDTMLYNYNPDQRIFPSSMAKLMTAIVALENGNLQDKVIVTKRALAYWQVGSVSAGLVAGEELTLEALLHCMMAASANDAAAVIAEHIGGTQDAFIAMMNEKAKDLGCRETNFTNAHGLHDENSYTTARDICRIADYALDNEDFRVLFSATSYTIPATNKSEERTIRTTNYMMEEKGQYYDARITGGKTGNDSSGRCLTATASGGGMELLTVVMGAQATYSPDGLSVERFGSFEETAALLDYAIANFDYRQVFYTGQVVAQYPVAGGENNVVVQPVSSQATVLPKDLDETKLNWIYGEQVGTITAPVEQGQHISTLQLWYGSKCLAQTALTAIHAVDVWTEPTQPARLGSDSGVSGLMIAGIVIGCIVLLALVTAGVFLGLRVLRNAKRDALRRSRRQNRRRS